MTVSVCRICFSMDLQEPGKHPRFWRWQGGYMGVKTCDKWCWNLMLVMTEALTWFVSKSRLLRVRADPVFSMGVDMANVV